MSLRSIEVSQAMSRDQVENNGKFLKCKGSVSTKGDEQVARGGGCSRKQILMRHIPSKQKNDS